MGPNKEVVGGPHKPPKPKPQPLKPKPLVPTQAGLTTAVTPSSQGIPPLSPPELSPLMELVSKTFLVLNESKTKLTRSCWLYYDTTPLYYEGIAFVSPNISLSKESSSCWWAQKSGAGVTLQMVTGTGLCLGHVPASHQSLCNTSYHPAQTALYVIPPEIGWWNCSTGLTPCTHLGVPNMSRDFYILVQLVPRLVYHPYEELLDR